MSRTPLIHSVILLAAALVACSDSGAPGGPDGPPPPAPVGSVQVVRERRGHDQRSTVQRHAEVADASRVENVDQRAPVHLRSTAVAPQRGSVRRGQRGGPHGDIVTRVRFDGVSQGEGTTQNIATRAIAGLPIRFDALYDTTEQAVLSPAIVLGETLATARPAKPSRP